MYSCHAAITPFYAEPEQIGQRIKRCRMSMQMSMNELQQILPVRITLQTLYKWEKGICLPGLDNLGNLARIFQISLDELVFGKANDDAA